MYCSVMECNVVHAMYVCIDECIDECIYVCMYVCIDSLTVAETNPAVCLHNVLNRRGT